MSKTRKIMLSESEMPKSWYNIQADLPEPLDPPLHPGTLKPLGPNDLSPIFPMSLIEQEMSQERWIEIPDEVREQLPGQRINSVRRRAKYLLLDTDSGSALLHLGMTGSLRVLPASTPVTTHDHVDFTLSSGRVLRFNDPRRFGCLLWQPAGQTHELLQALGPEPLADAQQETVFDGDYLFQRSRGRKAPIKTFLMDQRIVVGVGNIYAAESLFRAGISPLREAGKVSRERYVALAAAVQDILGYAITRGGTTLRDFISPDGMPGYFEQELQAYGRGGEPCPRCGRALKSANIGQRASVWCAHCQR